MGRAAGWAPTRHPTPGGFVDGDAELIKSSAIGFQYAAGNILALWDRV